MNSMIDPSPDRPGPTPGGSKVIDDPARGCMEEIGQVWQLVGALSEADKMRLFGRATLIEAALQCLSARFGSGGAGF